MPLIIWSAVSMNIFGGIFIVLMTRCMEHTPDTDAYDTKDKRNEAALFTMALLGTGEIIGGTFVIGKMRDSFGSKVALVLEIILTIIGMAFVI